MADEWYYTLLGEEFGPVPASTIVELLQSGTLASDDPVRQGSDGTWVAAHTLLGSFEDLGELELADEERPAAADLPLDWRSLADADPLAIEAGRSPSRGNRTPAGTATLPSEAPRPRSTAPQTVAAGSVWYCELLGVEVGPISRAELEEFARQGTLAPDDPVREGQEGGWIEARALAGLFPEETVAVIEPTAPAKPRKKSRRARGERNDAPPVSTPPETGWYWRLGGRELGPFTFDELAEMAADHRITADDFVRLGSQGEWQSARSIEGLVPIAAPSGQPVNSIAADAPAATEPSSPQEKWYAWLYGRDHGPWTRDEVLQKIAAGELRADIQVKLGADGDWKRLGSLEAEFGVAITAANTPSPTAIPTAAQPVMPVRPTSPAASFAATPRPSAPIAAPKRKSKVKVEREPIDWKGLFESYGKQLVALAVLLLVAGLYYVPLGSLFAASDASLLAKFDAVHDRLVELRTKNAPESEWKAFDDEIRGNFMPLASDLEKTASAAEPAKQNLLWAIKLVPGMVSGSHQRPNKDEEDFIKYVKRARELLSGQ